MSKRIVVCRDGTWNHPDQANPTNVYKLAHAVALKGPALTAEPEAGPAVQQPYYAEGVGAARGERIRGGAFGYGLSKDVCETYRYLVDHYEPNDELWFFGFSRGAFTVRSTVGLIRNAGILKREHADRVDEAYALYRSRRKKKKPNGRAAEMFRRSYSHAGETPIHFVGVWDTVGALGIPVSGFGLISLINRRWRFHDTDLSSSVANAFHALAIDEKRRPFKPSVWTIKKGDDGLPVEKNQRVEQVWFAGVHCGVGGGYPDSGLSDIALRWMVERAKECGLGFDDHALAFAPDLQGTLYESRTGAYRLLLPYHRDPKFSKTKNGSISATAAKRHADDPIGYAPKNFVRYLNSGDHTTPV